uniref:Receptor ligand binding region domain-containing protein n=1 Tax=Ditylenchus dipsaci TaxID=166011 RepID=A0A915DXN1_9BILA
MSSTLRPIISIHPPPLVFHLAGTSLLAQGDVDDENFRRPLGETRLVDVVAKTTVQQSARMLVAEFPGDIQIGALFPMHRQIAGAEGCGAVWEQYGIQRAEMAVLTVQELNQHLPFKLGISIRDSCWTERIAMEQVGRQPQLPFCVRESPNALLPNSWLSEKGQSSSGYCLSSQELNYNCCSKSAPGVPNPQIGYAATTTDLSDKEQFGYYLRVVPSDAWQARAINQLLRHFNWTYIAVVYSAANPNVFVSFLIRNIQITSGNYEVCIAHAQKVKSLANDKEFEAVMGSLLGLKPRPQVATDGQTGWMLFENVEDEAAGSFSIRIHSPRLVQLVIGAVYAAGCELQAQSESASGWLERMGEFWQQKFKCQLTVPKDDTVTRSQAESSDQFHPSGRLALKAMWNDKCKKRGNSSAPQHSVSSSSSNSLASSTFVVNNCPEMETVNGTLLYRYMINVTFVDQFQQEISFDSNGDPPAW